MSREARGSDGSLAPAPSGLPELLIGTQGHQEASLGNRGEACLHFQREWEVEGCWGGAELIHVLPEGGLAQRDWFPY